MKKLGTGIIVFFNIVGIICLIYYAVPYIMHDTSIPNPDAMLPMQIWEGAGMALTVGAIPLLVANLIAFLTLWKEKIKKPVRFLFFLPGLLCVVLAISFWIADLSNSVEGKGTISSAPIVNVKLELKELAEIHYGIIYEDGSVEVINEAFAVDDTDVYIADVNNFSAKTENGKVVNTLISTVVMDDEGNEVEADETLSNLLQIIADSAKHEILEAKMFKDGQMYYIAVQTNVNLQSPCDFYQYDPSAGKLLYLNSWDNVNVLGVATAK